MKRMGPIQPSIVDSLSIHDLGRDLDFMDKYYDAAIEITLWEADHVIYHIGDADAMSFKCLIRKAAELDPKAEIKPFMFSKRYQDLIAMHSKVIEDKWDYLEKRVDDFLGVVGKAPKSMVMVEVIQTWDQVPVREVRDMWRHELKRKAMHEIQDFVEYEGSGDDGMVEGIEYAEDDEDGDDNMEVIHRDGVIVYQTRM